MGGASFAAPAEAAYTPVVTTTVIGGQAIAVPAINAVVAPQRSKQTQFELVRRLTAQVGELTREKEKLMAIIETQRRKKKEHTDAMQSARAASTVAAAGAGLASASASSPPPSTSSLGGSGCKRPFCNACRMLVMDRMCGFLPFHPHPAVHERHATLFSTKVKEQYQMKDQKARKRKVDGAWCVHCRSESGISRTKKDRFTLMWDDPVVRQRVNTDWYKDVRAIDEELVAKARQLVELGEGGNGPVIKGLCDEIHELCTTRNANSGIRKTKIRLLKVAGATGSGPGPGLFADKVQEAAAVASAAQSAFSFRALENAVLSVGSAADIMPDVATLERVPGLQLDAGAEMSAMSMELDFNDVPSLGPGAFPGILDDVFGNAAGSSAGSARGAAFLPTQIEMRFTHVEGTPAHIADPSQAALCKVGLEAGFANLIADCEIPGLGADKIHITGTREGSIIISFVVHLVQRKTIVNPDELVSRVQEKIRSLTPEALKMLFPGLDVDAEFTSVRQLTSAELGAIVSQKAQTQNISAVATENLNLWSQLNSMVAPLREQCELLEQENRKLRRTLQDLDVSTAAAPGGAASSPATAAAADTTTTTPRSPYAVLTSPSTSEEEFDGFSDPEDASWWGGEETAPELPAKVTKVAAVPPKVETVTPNMKLMSIDSQEKLRDASKTGAELTGTPRMNHYVDEAVMKRFSQISN